MARAKRPGREPLVTRRTTITTRDKHNKKTRRDRLRLFKAGMQQHVVPSYKTITINGVAVQVTDILSAIDDDIAKCDAADKGHAAWLQQVEEERVSHLAVDPLVAGAEQFVRLTIGNTDAQQGVLADFGMSPTKKRVLTPEAKVVAAAKARATRARNKPAATAPAPTAPEQAATPAPGGTPTPGKQ